MFCDSFLLKKQKKTRQNSLLGLRIDVFEFYLKADYNALIFCAKRETVRDAIFL